MTLIKITEFDEFNETIFDPETRLSVADVNKYFGISENEIRIAIRYNKIPYLEIPGRGPERKSYRILYKDIKKYNQKQLGGVYAN